MTIVPVIIDARPAYLRSGRAPRSLLLTPIGTQTLLGCAVESVAAITDEPPTIAAPWAVGPEYVAHVRRGGAEVDSVISIDRFDEVLDRLEPSDWLLIVDSRHLPSQRDGLHELVRESAAAYEARHLVAMRANQLGTKEYVQLDDHGQVRRIQRFYDGMTRQQADAVAASMIPASAARGVPGAVFADLSALRETLVHHGVVSRDVSLSGGAVNLEREQGLLQFCERQLHSLVDQTPPAAYRERVPGVWIGRRCRVDPTARLYGPVVLEEDVRVDANVKLIGPVVVGAGSRVRHDSVIAQCLVGAGTDLPARSTVQRRVLCGQNGSAVASESDSSPVPLISSDPVPLRVIIPDQVTSRRRGRWQRNAYTKFKRAVESTVALFGLIVLAPLLLAVAAAIKLTSRGPAFFYHEREGKDGRTFRCCKYRTMVVDAHRQQRALYRENAVDGPQFKLDRDPRITQIGNWIRRSNLDELPQLFNVLLGQMSLIGPRPSPFRENQICVPWREARLSVRPGITGLWQICRQDRSAGDFHQWIHYDMLYVRHVSPWLDLKILVATLLTLGGRWSIPVTWLIPVRKLRAEQGSPAVRRPVSLTLASALVG